MKFTVEHVDDLAAVSRVLCTKFNHRVILLSGDLGSGKTTLTKALLKELNGKDEASSPTYSIVNEYEIEGGKLFHFDLYRLNHLDEALDFGIDEYLDSGNYCFIEWPELVLPLLDNNYHTIDLQLDGHKRRITFS